MHSKSKTEQSKNYKMSRVKSKDTKPEIIVRKLAHSLGYRFRLHRKDLPGTPDLTFPSRMKVIFVHGCFWHRHRGCRKTTTPKTNMDFWKNKFRKNIQRDKNSIEQLKGLGWKALVIWECETKNIEEIQKKIVDFLG